jgi:hypothetical protein
MNLSVSNLSLGMGLSSDSLVLTSLDHSERIFHQFYHGHGDTVDAHGLHDCPAYLQKPVIVEIGVSLMEKIEE